MPQPINRDLNLKQTTGGAASKRVSKGTTAFDSEAYYKAYKWNGHAWVSAKGYASAFNR